MSRGRVRNRELATRKHVRERHAASVGDELRMLGRDGLRHASERGREELFASGRLRWFGRGRITCTVHAHVWSAPKSFLQETTCVGLGV